MCHQTFYIQNYTFEVFCKKNKLGAQIFLICLLLFSTCFGQLSSGENTVHMRHLVFVTLKQVYSKNYKGLYHYDIDPAKLIKRKPSGSQPEYGV